VPEWKQFEDLVARIHSTLDKGQFTVEQNVRLSEPTGAEHQVDVLLRPKSLFHGPVLISCKSSAHPVEVGHVREWSNIVEHTGAAAGVIVSPTGFTSGAIDHVRNPARRISLWIARPLTEDDLSPDALRSIQYTLQSRTPFPRLETFKMDTEPVSPSGETRVVTMTLSAATRDRYFLTDEHGNTMANLWDEYIAVTAALSESGAFRIEFSDDRFLMVEGRRVKFNHFTGYVDIGTSDIEVLIDLTIGVYVYENALTGHIRQIPLNG
jgi:Restriction endonuclease